VKRKNANVHPNLVTGKGGEIATKLEQRVALKKVRKERLHRKETESRSNSQANKRWSGAQV